LNQSASTITVSLKKFGRTAMVVIGCSGASALAAATMLYVLARSASAGRLSIGDAASFVAAFVAFVVMFFASHYVQASLDAEFADDLRLTLVRRILATNYDNALKTRGHDLFNVVTTDISNITRAISSLPYFALNCVKMGACVIFMAYLSPHLFLVSIIPIVTMVAVSHILTSRAYTKDGTVRSAMDRVLDGFKGTIDGARELGADAALRSIHYFSMREDAAILREETLSRGRTWAWNRVLTSALLFVILGTNVAVGVGHESPRVLGLIVLLTTYCISSYDVIITGVQLMSTAWSSANRISDLDLSEDPDSYRCVVDSGRDVTASDWSQFHVEDVTYQYPANGDDGETFQIGPVSFSMNRGEILFLCGGNGSGKTTLMSVILGLLPSQSGAVRLDEENFSDRTTSSWQSRIASVHADFYLFPYVVIDESRPESEVIAEYWLKVFELDGVVSIVDGKFSTLALSRGQRKRLALVAALSTNREIYLLDEWAADQDPHFRSTFYEKVLPTLKGMGKTIIAISHDDRYFHVADQVIYLDVGKVVRPLNKAIEVTD